MPSNNKPAESATKSYPIRTVARLTGLTPDLIRAWERRYAVVAPVRGPRGARLYGAEDVARLERLARVVDVGHSIGDIAHLSDAELSSILFGASQSLALSAESEPLPAVSELLARVDRLDMVGFERGLGHALLALGAAEFTHEVVLPLVHAVGERWGAGTLSIGQEHLVTAALRNLLGSLIRSRRDPGATSIALTSVSGERHELGLLIVAVLAADQGIGVHLLGPDLPADEIVATTTQLGPGALGLSFVGEANRAAAVRCLRQVQAELAPTIPIWAGGADAANVVGRAADERTVLIQDLAELQLHLGLLRDRPIGSILPPSA